MQINLFAIRATTLFVLLSFNLVGQIVVPEYVSKFGKGPITLKNKVNVSFLFDETSQSYHAKIKHRYDKLYTNNKDKNGLVQVPFNDFQSLKLEKARYFKLDTLGKKRLIENVKVKYSDVKDFFVENIFYSDLKVKQFKCAVDLPKEYVISYSYEETYKDLKFLNSLFFQSSNEAVENVEISIKKDPNVDLSIHEFNLKKITKTEDLDYIKYTGKNLNRYKTLASSVSGSYYLPHIIISTKEITVNNKKIEVLKSTDNIYSWYNSLINELQPNKELISNLSIKITKNSTTDIEKIEAIFKWVQNNIQYIAFENGIAGFKPSEAHEVASSKYGDCKGMANLLVQLLKSQNFDAQYAWIGTRNRNYTYKTPSLVVDNHMICALNFENKTFFLDGTSKSALWDTPPAHLEGKEVLISNGDNYTIQTIKISNFKDNIININGSIDIKNPKANINLSIELKGHFRREFISYTQYAPLKKNKYMPYYFLYDYIEGIVIEKITEPVISENSITFKISGKYTNTAINSSSKIVFPFLDVFTYNQINESNPPIYIKYPQNINVELQVINGNRTPKETYKKQKIGNENYSAEYFTQSIGNKFTVNQKLKLNILNTSAVENNSWNTFANQIKAYNNYPLTYE